MKNNMNQLQVFGNQNFGEIRTLDEKGKILFCGSDVAKALGYKDTVNALKSHCNEDGVVFHHIIDSLGRQQKVKFISEGNVYRLITHSKLPAAEQFERWVFDEVLPSIRKHGTYSITPDKKMRMDIELYKAQTKKAEMWMKLGEYVGTSEYKQICASYASGVLVDGDPVLPLPESMERYYSATQVGEMFGVSANKIGKLANQYNLKQEPYGKWFFDKAAHSMKEVETFRYGEAGIKKFEELLKMTRLLKC